MLAFGHLLQCNKHLHPLVNSVGIEHPQHLAGLCLLSGDYQQGLGAYLEGDTSCAGMIITRSRSIPLEVGTCFRSHRHCLNCTLNQH